MSKPAIPRCGDQVRHLPTGQTWTVSYADAERNELSWCGWPEGRAKLSDCELTYRCTDEEHEQLISEWLNTKPELDGHTDLRVANVARLYRPENART